MLHFASILAEVSGTSILSRLKWAWFVSIQQSSKSTNQTTNELTGFVFYG